jgi:hypothetical protein
MVLDAARHHDELAFLDPLAAVAECHAETAFDHQEHFVFVVVMMEDELALDLVDLT